MSKKVKDHSYCIEWKIDEQKGRHSFGLSYWNAKMLAEAFDSKHANIGITHRPVKIKKGR